MIVSDNPVLSLSKGTRNRRRTRCLPGLAIPASSGITSRRASRRVRRRTRKATGGFKPARCFTCAHARQHRSVSGCRWMKGGGHVTWHHVENRNCQSNSSHGSVGIENSAGSRDSWSRLPSTAKAGVSVDTCRVLETRLVTLHEFSAPIFRGRAWPAIVVRRKPAA